jgi:isocitrate dehydrogenase
MATLFAWTGAIRKRGELDGTPDVAAFADALEKAALDTVEKGIMTGDLARLAEPAATKICSTGEFIDEIARTLDGIWK